MRVIPRRQGLLKHQARIWLMSAVMSLALVTNLPACSPKSPSASHSSSTGPSSTRSIVVFAAASLKPTFTLLAGKFQTDNPGATVNFDFASSSELATQLT